MNAPTLLDHLRTLGVAVRVAGDKLELEPGSLVPEAMVDEIRAVKPDIIALLAQPVDASATAENPQTLPAGAMRLVDRFRAGQARLERDRDALDALPDAGVGSEAEHAYCALFADVIAVETLLGFVYPSFDGCARGDAGPCAPLAIVRSAYCAEGSA